MTAIVALLLVALVGGAGAFWAYKKYQQKQNQEYELEGEMPFAVKAGTQPENVKKEMLSVDLLDQVIEKHNLLEMWGMSDKAAAQERIREKFNVIIEDTKLRVTYRGKDKELTQDVLHSIANGFIDKMKKARAVPGTN